ncbi:hypothetical protein DIPPA_08597 [Diplonema papillatum]|nr:hypothetical protein DIPPA_08597 [Diplonema papillatum]
MMAMPLNLDSTNTRYARKQSFEELDDGLHQELTGSFGSSTTARSGSSGSGPQGDGKPEFAPLCARLGGASPADSWSDGGAGSTRAATPRRRFSKSPRHLSLDLHPAASPDVASPLPFPGLGSPCLDGTGFEASISLREQKPRSLSGTPLRLQRRNAVWC